MIDPAAFFEMGSKIGAVNSPMFGPGQIARQALDTLRQKGLIQDTAMATQDAEIYGLKRKMELRQQAGGGGMKGLFAGSEGTTEGPSLVRTDGMTFQQTPEEYTDAWGLPSTRIKYNQVKPEFLTHEQIKAMDEQNKRGMEVRYPGYKPPTAREGEGNVIAEMWRLDQEQRAAQARREAVEADSSIYGR